MEQQSYIYGRNAVIESLAGENPPVKIFVSFSAQGASINRIYKDAKKQSIPIVKYDKKKFNELEKKVVKGDSPSQGVIALAEMVETVDIRELARDALSKSSSPVLVALDGINDPHNLGAIARSAECSGAYGIILPKRGAAPVTPVAIKVSAGALEHITVASVNNLLNALEACKEEGYWIVGAEVGADQTLYNSNFNLPVVLVIGSEGKGIKSSIVKHCDFTFRIPMYGKIESLNASVSAGIILFEIARQKHQNIT